ncbi:MAG: peptidoglycan DD-metalloendopeptidase family protein [Firmicutes bacterium]|nr:peptidoglycan DD-metalloendopeptidase family protein [Bacillota bacterium]
MAAGSKKGNKSFTVLVLPHSGEKSLSFPLKVSWLKAAAAILLVATFSLLVFGIRYRRLSSDVAAYTLELRQLREENTTQKALLREYEIEAGEVQERLDRLEALDNQIRNLIDKDASVFPAGAVSQEARNRAREQRMALSEVSRSRVPRGRQGLFDGLIEEASVREGSLTSLRERLVNLIAYLRARPSLRPVAGLITSPYGYRRSPVSRSRSEFHEGIDIGAPYGTPVSAAGDGVVTFAGYHGGLGRTVVIDHGYGIKSWYGHCSRIEVRQGDKVTRGTVIARVGSSGFSTGPHLHYQVTVDGAYVDPQKYFQATGEE